VNVLLFRPANWHGEVADRRRGKVNFLPLGLMAIAAPLEKAGVRVRIIDQCEDADWKELLLGYLKEKPVCVGITVKTGQQISYSLSVSRLIKDNYPDIPIVWGGVHPTILPEQTVAHPDVDIVVEGDGEETFFELVAALKEKKGLENIKGICYKDNGMIKRNSPRLPSDLVSQPALPYHLVDVKKYVNKLWGRPALNTFSSRGCSHRCRYCYLSSYRGKYRALSAACVLQNAADLKERFAIRGIGFVDDNFFADRKRGMEILRGLKEMGLLWHNINVPLDALSLLGEEFLQLHRGADWTSIHVGIESGSQRVLDFLNKGISISQLAEINKKLSRYKIACFYNFIVGTPTETEEDLRETISVILQLVHDNPNAEPRVYTFLPYPGTELYDFCVKSGHFKPPDRLEDWVTLTNLTIDKRDWLTERKKRILEMLSFCTPALTKKILERELSYVYPTALVSLAMGVVRAYRPVAKMRIKHMYHGFLIEKHFAKLFGHSRKLPYRLKHKPDLAKEFT